MAECGKVHMVWSGHWIRHLLIIVLQRHRLIWRMITHEVEDKYREDKIVCRIKKSHRKIFIIGGIAAAIMFAFCFAMVPLYSLICKKTGIEYIRCRIAGLINFCQR